MKTNYFIKDKQKQLPGSVPQENVFLKILQGVLQNLQGLSLQLY